jgi:hypothetical protein
MASSPAANQRSDSAPAAAEGSKTKSGARADIGGKIGVELERDHRRLSSPIP